MKRLTTDHPDGNFEMAMNFVYGKDGAAYIRSDGERDDVPLHEWAKAQCLAHGCGEFPGETMEEIDEEICSCGFDFPGCPIHLAYTFACQAAHLRTRLKRYEDTGMEPEQVRQLAAQEANAPLTLEELREMDGKPVWVVELNGYPPHWGLIYWCRKNKRNIVYVTISNGASICVEVFMAAGGKIYRRKPEEAGQTC